MVSTPNGGAQPSFSSSKPPISSVSTSKAQPPPQPRPKATYTSSSVAIATDIPLSARRDDPLIMQTVSRHVPASKEPPPRTHLNSIPEAPTFYPTEDEWREPMAYIRKIAPEGRKYGIVKLIPPKSWQPDFAIDTKRFHFRTRKQEMNSVEGGTRVNVDYMDQLAKFHKSQGMNLNRFPSVDKRPLDLYELKKAVESRGGFERVCKGKKWAEVGRILGYSGKIMSSLSTSLKNSYAKWLEPYERFLAGAKPAVQWQLEQERGGPYGTPSPGPSPVKRSSHPTPSSLGKEAPAMLASQALNESLHRDANPMPTSRPLFNFTSEPARPSSGFTPVNAPSSGFTAVNSQQQFKPIASSPQQPLMNGANGHTGSPLFSINGYGPHELKRSFSESTDDFGSFERDEAIKKKKPKVEGPPTVTGSHMNFNRASGPPSKEHNNWGPGDFCQICGKGDDDPNILLCESCRHGSHTYCLNPPLMGVPDNDWHCPKCLVDLVGTGEYGFDEGQTYSLKQFQEQAFWFKENHFKMKQPFDPILDRPRAPSEADVEREFWRLVGSTTETVEVEYGADIHTNTHGSGFPTLETHPRNQYSTHPWNLNNLSLHKDSLFQYIRSDVSGMTVPWLYVGMVFSTFCWHNEDHYTFSANYQHFGDTKTWYGIPGADAERFEAAMKNAVPELFEKQPDLLFQLVTLLQPDLLQKAGVKVFACDQRAGQMVITFPQAYHAGFNHGFNFNEAVNFATPEWEPFGSAAVERLRDFRKPPAFSHDELLLTAAAGRDVSIKSAKWLSPALERMLLREKTNRSDFEARVAEGKFYRPHDDSDFRFQFERTTDNADLHEDAYTCTYCKAYAYLSRFVCSHTKSVACLDHIAVVDCCQEPEGHTVHVRMTTYRLEQAVQKISDKARLPDVWMDKFEAAVADTPKPQLKTLRTLLGEGEKIPWHLPQLAELRKFVERCNEWVEDAQTYITRKQQNRKKNSKAWRKNGAKANEADDREEEAKGFAGMVQLLKDADYIGFECQEIVNLQEKVDSIKDFQNQSRKALNDVLNYTTQQFEDLIELGKSFPVDIPEIEHLEKIVKQMRWRDRASDYSHTKSLEEVTDLIEEASVVNVPAVNEHILFLKDRKLRGEMWEQKAKELISVENVHYGQLDILSRTAEGLPVTKETLATVDAFLKKQRDAAEQITKLYNRTKAPDLRQRPHYRELNELLTSIADLSSKPAAAQDIERVQRKHEDWMRRGKRLFGKANAPLHILHQHLKILDERNVHCLDLADKPRMPVEPSSRQVTPDPEHEGVTSGSMRDVFCLCRRSESGMMIECHVCNEWYHSKCLKIARGKLKADDTWVCPICSPGPKRIPRDANRPKLEEMIALRNEIPSLPFQPDEEDTLDSIVNVAQNFREHMRQYVQVDSLLAPSHEEVPIMRFYLRKIEGADVLLAEETNFFSQELWRLVPLAKQPPEIIETSSSTRKPRPTKVQKLMVKHGVQSEEELPAHLRSKPSGKRKSITDGGAGDSQTGGSDTTRNEAGPAKKLARSLSGGLGSRRGSDGSGSISQSHNGPYHLPPHSTNANNGGTSSTNPARKGSTTSTSRFGGGGSVGGGTSASTPTASTHAAASSQSLNFRQPLTGASFPAHMNQDQRLGPHGQHQQLHQPRAGGLLDQENGEYEHDNDNNGGGTTGAHDAADDNNTHGEQDTSGLNPNLFDSSNAAGLAAFAVEAERLGQEQQQQEGQETGHVAVNTIGDGSNMVMEPMALDADDGNGAAATEALDPNLNLNLDVDVDMNLSGQPEVGGDEPWEGQHHEIEDGNENSDMAALAAHVAGVDSTSNHTHAHAGTAGDQGVDAHGEDTGVAHGYQDGGVDGNANNRDEDGDAERDAERDRDGRMFADFMHVDE